MIATSSLLFNYTGLSKITILYVLFSSISCLKEESSVNPTLYELSTTNTSNYYDLTNHSLSVLSDTSEPPATIASVEKEVESLPTKRNSSNDSMIESKITKQLNGFVFNFSSQVIIEKSKEKNAILVDVHENINKEIEDIIPTEKLKPSPKNSNENIWVRKNYRINFQQQEEVLFVPNENTTQMILKKSKKNIPFYPTEEHYNLTTNSNMFNRSRSRFKTETDLRKKQKFIFFNNYQVYDLHPTVPISDMTFFRSNKYSRNALRNVKVLTLLGLFELTTKQGDRPEGKSELAAARLAIKHINDLNVLPGYKFELISNDTKCNPGVGVDRFFHAIYTRKQLGGAHLIMLLGTASSEVTESLAKIAPYWNMVQVSFGSESPALSDRREFPLFARTAAPASAHRLARAAFIHRFGWSDAVAALGDAPLTVSHLAAELEQANITCIAAATFAATDFKDQIRMLREKDARIIIGSFSYKMAPKIFCEAYHLKMYGSDYAWIIQGDSDDVLWLSDLTSIVSGVECTTFQLAAVTEGLILVSSYNSIVGSKTSLSGMTNQMFAAELKAAGVGVSRYAPHAYDAIWTMALALRGAERRIGRGIISQFDYTRRDMADEFLYNLFNLNFSGISGPVSFSGADRVGTSVFNQIQGGSMRTIALFYSDSRALDFACPQCVPPKWAGDQVPIAKRVFRVRITTIAPIAFLIVASLAVVGITAALAFLLFNIHFRSLKSIKLSSPRLNNMAAIGCVLVYAAVILLGLDHATIHDNDYFSIICTARVYLLSAGFSLAFGSMFTKTYRVHHIFTRGVRYRAPLHDKQLILAVCVLLLADAFIITFWVSVDPMERYLHNLTLEISTTDRGVVYQPQVEVCRSQHTTGWLSALYAYKGLLLVVGVYMAWETRHVKVPALNDSEHIGMSVYSVVITSGIVVVLAQTSELHNATLAFVTTTVLILLSTTGTLCLLFVPRLLQAAREDARRRKCDSNAETLDTEDPVVESMGLKIECNTRRFLTDDKRELQYRVEVKNRVYLREIAALNLEISRLELLIESPLSNASPRSSVSSNSPTGVHRRMDINIDDITSAATQSEQHKRAPSITEGLPLLLLSVLPPVIPRASWPTTDISSLHPIHNSVIFSSEPKLDEKKSRSVSGSRENRDIELLSDRLCVNGHDRKMSIFTSIRKFFGSKTSVGGSSNIGIASALKVHMGYIAGFVPTSSKTMTVSCNASSLSIHQISNLPMNSPSNKLKRHSYSPGGNYNGTLKSFNETKNPFKKL